MVHMQHAHVVALLVRQHEAARLKAEKGPVASACDMKLPVEVK